MLLAALRRLYRRRVRGRRPPKPALYRRPFLEALEDRTLLATQFVDFAGLHFLDVPGSGGTGFFKGGTNGNDLLVRGGTVELGLTPANGNTAFLALVDINLNEGGNNDGVLTIHSTSAPPTFQITNGSLDSVVQGGVPIPIWQTADAVTPVTFNANQLLGQTGADLTTGGAPFKVAGFDFTLSNLRFVEPTPGDTSTSQVWMQGSIAFDILKDKLSTTAPTVTVNGQNHVVAAPPTLTSPTGITLTGAKFTFAGQKKTFNAQNVRTTDLGVKIKYSNANHHDTWTFDGSVAITTQPQGTGNEPALSNVAASLGMILQDGDFAGIDFSVAGSFSVLGLQVQTDPGKSIDLDFDVGRQLYQVRGSLKITAPDATTGNANSIDINLGDVNAGQKGVVIQDGQMTQFNATVNTDFTLFGANVSTNGAGLDFSYDGTPGKEQFEMYGQVMVTVPNGTDVTGKKKYTSITALMGDADNPGLLLKNGALTQINMGVSGQFNVYGLTLQADALNCDWTNKTGQDVFELSGGLTLRDVFQISAGFGTETNPGLQIVNGQFALTNFTFTAERLDFGAFIIQDFTVTYSTDPTQGYTIGIKLDLVFPAGWEVGGKLTLDDGIPDDLTLLYGSTTGIPIGPTGVFLTYMSASVQNLDNPANLIVSGSAAFVYGDQVQLLGHEVTIAAFTGSFFVDKDELVLTGSAALAAVQQGGGTNNMPVYQGYLGQGTAKVTLDWGDQVYKADVNVSLFDGTFTVSAEFNFSGDPHDYSILFQAQVDVNIPKFVPIVGGDTLTSLNFVFDYHSILDPNTGKRSVSGFLAAWLQEHIIWTFDVGFEYDFDPAPDPGPDHRFSLIGSKGVADIEHEINHPPNSQTYAYTYTYQVPAGATGAVFKMDWPAGEATPTFSVQPPGAKVPISQEDFAASGISLVPTEGSSSSQNIRIVGSTSEQDKPLTAGSKYMVILTSTQKYSTEPKFRASFIFPKPTVALGPVTGGTDLVVPVSLSGTVDEAFASSTTTQTHVSLYVDSNNTGYHGTLLPSARSLPVYADGQGNWTADATWDLTGLLPLPYYVYAVINDGVNTPVFSAYSDPVLPTPPLSGTVHDPEHDNRALSGQKVYLDVNHNGQFDPGTDPFTFTGATGFYAFYTTDRQGHTVLPVNTPLYVGVAATPGFELQTSPVPFTYPGTGTYTIDFKVAQLATISGTVHEDLAGDPPAANATLRLLDNTTGKQVLTYSHSDGSYEFRGLTVGDTYTVGVSRTSTLYYQTSPPFLGTYTVPITGKYQLPPGNDFGVLPFGEVSGNVAGTIVQNGKLNPNRVPLGGWTVNLMSGGQVVATTTSARDGSYVFKTLPAGQYTVAIGQQAGYRQMVPYQPNPQFSSPGQLIRTAGAPSSVAAGDFNGDGYKDFAATVPGGVGVYLGSQGGTYQYTLLATAFSSPVKVVALQLNGPSPLLALAVANGRGQVQVWQSTGGAGWTNLGILWQLPAGDTFNNMVAGDFHGNVPGGPPRDLAVVYRGTDGGLHLAALLSNASHSVVLTPGTLYDSGTSSPVGLASGYINDDGHDDLLINARLNTGKLNVNPTIAYGFGNGAFSLNADAIQSFLTGGVAAVADVNGDGLPDVVVGVRVPGPFGGKMTLYINQQVQRPDFSPDGPGTFGEQLEPSADVTPVGAALATFAGGLTPDLAVVLQNGAVNVFSNQGASPYFRNEARYVLTLPAGSAPVDMASSDLNNDGLPDLVLADPGTGGGRILLNQSTNTAGFSVSVTPGQTTGGNDFVVVPAGPITGSVSDDANRNGRRDPGERGLAGVPVYLDRTGSGQYVPGIDPVTTTGAGGAYQFANVLGRAYGVGVLTPPGRIATGAGAYQRISGAPGRALVGAGFTLARRLLQPVADRTALEGTVLAVPVRLTGAQGNRRLLYSLAAGAPAGAHIDPFTGVFWWPTGGVRPPGTVTITVRVTDPLRPAVTETIAFRVTVLPSPLYTFVRGLYYGVLHRAPDPLGFAAWVAALRAGLSPARAVAAFWAAVGSAR